MTKSELKLLIKECINENDVMSLAKFNKNETFQDFLKKFVGLNME